MQKELHLELSREKTKITNLSDKRVRFLGYEITKSQESTKQVVDSIGRKKRSVNGTIQLVVREMLFGKSSSRSLKGKTLSGGGTS